MIVLLGLLALAWCFGGLAVWPLYRKVRPNHEQRLAALKVVFWLHVVGQGVALLLIVATYLSRAQDAENSLVLLYLVGTGSLAASAVILIVGTAFDLIL